MLKRETSQGNGRGTPPVMHYPSAAVVSIVEVLLPTKAVLEEEAAAVIPAREEEGVVVLAGEDAGDVGTVPGAVTDHTPFYWAMGLAVFTLWHRHQFSHTLPTHFNKTKTLNTAIYCPRFYNLALSSYIHMVHICTLTVGCLISPRGTVTKYWDDS